MAYYYSNIDNAEGFLPDDRGQDLFDRNAAIAEAGRTPGSILTDDLRHGLNRVTIRVMVEDERRHPVATIAVSAKVTE